MSELITDIKNKSEYDLYGTDTINRKFTFINELLNNHVLSVETEAVPMMTEKKQTDRNLSSVTLPINLMNQFTNNNTEKHSSSRAEKQHSSTEKQSSKANNHGSTEKQSSKAEKYGSTEKQSSKAEKYGTTDTDIFVKSNKKPSSEKSTKSYRLVSDR